jgi:hypothetical protein
MEELTRSGMELQSRLGREIVSFCYPRGKCDAEVIQRVEKAGYRCAVVTPTCSGMPLSYYTLRRIGIYYANTPWLFRLKTTPCVRRNYERVKRLRWKQG